MTTSARIVVLVDPTTKDDAKLKAANELSLDLQFLLEMHPLTPQQQKLFETIIDAFLKVFQDSEPQFISENCGHQLRKLLLEIIQRLPPNDTLRPHVNKILKLMFKLFEVENEENVQVILRIIIELHKTYRPEFIPETQAFLESVKRLYSEMHKTFDMTKVFEPRTNIKVEELTPAILSQLLSSIYTVTPIETEQKTPDGKIIVYNLIPRAKVSLKVLSDLPIIVVLLYQLHKNQLHQTVAEFVPLIMDTITLQPPDSIKNSERFDKEIYVEFIGAQIKSLSFIAYIVRLYQEVISLHSAQLVRGMLMLFRDCPNEVSSLRRELLAAARHVFATNLKFKFVPHIESFFDEDLLIGRGWTAYESLRPIAYNTLADLVHHVRASLTLKDLAAAINTFSKNLHDDTIPPYVQLMSCKLLLTLADCCRSQSQDRDPVVVRELMIRLIEIFVLKFKIIATQHLPVLFQRVKSQALHHQQQQYQQSQAAIGASLSSNENHVPVGATQSTSGTTTTPASSVPTSKTDTLFSPGIGEIAPLRDEKSKFDFPPSPSQNYSIAECKSMVKTLVIGVKTVTSSIPTYKCPGTADLITTPPDTKFFHPKETILLVRLVKYALKALDIYMIAPQAQGVPHPMGQGMNRQHAAQQNVRSKEEKEILEAFANIFTTLNPLTFHEIFSTLIDYLIERMHQNGALQVVINSFLATSPTSPIFATILLEYLLVRMEEIGSNMEKSNLYLRLFKMVFGSVSLYAVENEKMLKPHLHNIVNRSMELALGAKDPYNYFLLLRALFRSIGGGSHDLLYQEFLPLLPNLLQGLNSLQSGLHKQHVKDLFVELCLTVPVRLSSLLPYLPMLMDPLVSALNGSQSLISQGLRTLELCVDNLQPDFLYEHIQPVRAELMQALWRTLRNPFEPIAAVSFRVLGKFGGGNRKMMMEPQKLNYIECKEYYSSRGSSVAVHFPDQRATIQLSVERVIEAAYHNLKQVNTDQFYRMHSWEVIRGFLVASIGDSPDQQVKMVQFFSNPALSTIPIPPKRENIYKFQDAELRKVHETALTGMFLAAALRELRDTVLPFMTFVVRHYVLVAIGQHLSNPSDETAHTGMDPLVLIDALTTILGEEEREFCKPGHYALVLILDTATLVLRTKERACELPFISYLVKKIYKLCYERAWYAKIGGCAAIKFLFEQMPLRWVLRYHKKLVKALFYVMRDLTGEVSSGAIDMAQTNLAQLLTICGKVIETPQGDIAAEELVAIQTKSLNDVTELLVREVTSPNLCVRTQAMQSLELLAKLQGRTVTQLMESHREIIEKNLPPSDQCLQNQPVRTQIGLIHGTTFCTSLEPRFFTIDPSRHESFLRQLIKICEDDDTSLHRLACYNNVTNLVPVRIAAIQALAACHYLKGNNYKNSNGEETPYEEKIFSVLYRSTESTNRELQDTGYTCLKQFISHVNIEIEVVTKTISSIMVYLQEYKQWDLNALRRFKYIAQLFPTIFTDKYCEQLLDHLKKWCQHTITEVRSGERATHELKICAGFVELFVHLRNASQNFVDVLMITVFRTEKSVMIEPGSPFREPLKRFLLRYPEHSVNLMFSERNLHEDQVYRFVKFLFKGPDGEKFREVAKQQLNFLKLIRLASGVVTESIHVASIQPGPPGQEGPQIGPQIQRRNVAYDLRYQAVLITSILVKYDETWLSSSRYGRQLVEVLQTIWLSEDFHKKHAKIDTVEFMQWKEPKLIVRCLLNFFQHNHNEPSSILLLFHLLRAFMGRYLCDFEFLRVFLEKTVIETYSIEWKRKAFNQFVDIFPDPNYSQELKAKILRYIILPMFSHSFDKGLGEALIGGPPQPDKDLPTNLISLFINKVIDVDNVHVSDSVRIMLLQFSCLLMEQASAHIHDAANKRQGSRLRRLMTFGWPCLQAKNCVDPATKYHGHLLLSHIIAKFAVHRRIVLQVFHSLLKAYAVEARGVVRQALEILTPAMPHRIENGDQMLTLWTKRIITEEGHTLAQLVHILQLLVRHYKVYYPVRNHLIQYIVNSIQRLGFTPNQSLDHKRIAADLCEVVLRWEIQRIRDQRERQSQEDEHNAENAQASESTDQDREVPMDTPDSSASTAQQTQPQQPAAIAQPLPLSNEPMVMSQPMDSSQPMDTSNNDATIAEETNNMSQQTTTSSVASSASPMGSLTSQPASSAQASVSQPNGVDAAAAAKAATSTKEASNQPLDPTHVNAIVNFLLRLACQVNDPPHPQAPPNYVSPGDSLSKRCVVLLKSALRPDIWPNPDLRLGWFDKLLCSIENPNPNIGNICTALELLSFLCNTLPRETVLVQFKSLQRGIIACINSTHPKVIRPVSSLLQRLMSVFPVQSNPPLTGFLGSTSQATSAGSTSPGAQSQGQSSVPLLNEGDLETLYNAVGRIILEGLNNYDKTVNAPPSILFSTLMILKAACVNNASYIDRVMPSFMRVLQKLAKDHISSGEQTSPIGCELLSLSLDLAKNRINSMNQDTRKMFIQHILAALIEKSSDVKVLKTITKMVEDWIKNKPQQLQQQSQATGLGSSTNVQATGSASLNQGPNIREKILLLIKLMLHIEKRHPYEMELNAQFLELINYVYRDDELRNTELTGKLESAFMSGLRCVQPHIRAKFFQVFDQSVKPKLYERLMYIVCAQNWETIQHHFWIQQCIEFILVIAASDVPITSNEPHAALPVIPTSIDLCQYNYNLSDMEVVETSKTDNGEVSASTDETSTLELVDDIELATSSHGQDLYDVMSCVVLPAEKAQADPRKRLLSLLAKQSRFLDSKRDMKTGAFLRSLAQLCHLDPQLAHQVWINMFPRIWKILNEPQMTLLGREIVPFLCSGSHVLQKDCHPSALGTFMEAVALCQPSIQIRPILLRYLGKNHNLWQRAALMLEEMCHDKSLEVTYPQPARPSKANQQNVSDFDFMTLSPNTTIADEAVDSLADLLELLHEEDLWVGLWRKRAQYKETIKAITYEQHGMFSEAQETYEAAMQRQRQEFDMTSTIAKGMKSENRLWEKHWIRCSKELNQWDTLLEYGNSKLCGNPILVLDSAWRVPNWHMMKDALKLVELNCPVELAWRVALYKGFNSICNPDDYNLLAVDQMVELSSSYCIQEWRRLPHIVSHVHINLLQAAQQIMELQEAMQIHSGFLPQNMGRPNQLHDMKAIVKTWRNRLPIVSDDLSHWSDIFTWRQHHYQAIVSHFEAQQHHQQQTAPIVVPTVVTGGAGCNASGGTPPAPATTPQFVTPGAGPDSNASSAMLGVHASAQSIIHFGKIARKQSLIPVCLDSINRIHTIPSVPIVDCFQKIKQQVKCYLQLYTNATTFGVADPAELQDGLEIIESTNLKYFAKDMVAEFYALKGVFLSHLGRHDEANKSFSAAAQLHDALPKAWSTWGDYMETRFMQDYNDNAPPIIVSSSGSQQQQHASQQQASTTPRRIDLGVSAITCYLQACRHTSEHKARKYLAKVIWLISYDDERMQLSETVDKYYIDVPQINWLAWIPQLLQCLVRNEGNNLASVVARVGKAYPQAVYFPTRTLYLTLKMYINAQREKGTQVAAPQCLRRCTSIMKMQRDTHPTTLSSLEGIVDQMVWFREYWYEEVQRQLQQALAKCYALAFENRDRIADSVVTAPTLSFVKKLGTTFGVGIAANSGNTTSTTTNSNSANTAASVYSTAASEVLAERVQATSQDPEFQRTKLRFRADFDEASLPNMKLLTLIAKLKKWIRILEHKNKTMPKSYLIEEKCRFLANFSQHTADVELPGESLVPKLKNYYVRIARFMPEVEVISKHQTAARRIKIRGHNGKVYPYLVVNDSCFSDARREERVLQLLRLLNIYLVKRKETARRFLSFTVPRVVPVSPQMRLVEDNPASLSLLDIFKRRLNYLKTNETDVDAPITKYYEKLIAIQAMGNQVSQHNLREILIDLQTKMIPAKLLKDWASQTYISEIDYWAFRNQFTLQLSLAAFCEYVLHLTQLNPEMMYLHQDSGLINVAYYRFDVDDTNGELAAQRPVPFRLTQNISELITSNGVAGPFTASLISLARCLLTPNFKVTAILRAILRDEAMAWYKRGQDASRNTYNIEDEMQGILLIETVNKATTAITARMRDLASMDNLVDTRAAALVSQANSYDQLCLMNPSWQPWL
ncbi:Transformation/transcription domain-associated protein, partial [Fragariocoptes setiger]